MVKQEWEQTAEWGEALYNEFNQQLYIPSVRNKYPCSTIVLATVLQAIM